MIIFAAGSSGLKISFRTAEPAALPPPLRLLGGSNSVCGSVSAGAAPAAASAAAAGVHFDPLRPTPGRFGASDCSSEVFGFDGRRGLGGVLGFALRLGVLLAFALAAGEE